jgi:threonine/homoserine/homoserine lactone efflux protein
LIVFTVMGLAVLAKTLGTLFIVIKLGGAAYILWLGYKLWHNPPRALNTLVYRLRHDHLRPFRRRARAAYIWSLRRRTRASARQASC